MIKYNFSLFYNIFFVLLQLIYQKKYKIDIKTTDLFRKFIGEKKTYFEFLEALPKLEPRILYYVLVSYYFCWHRCYRQLWDTIHVFPALNITYKKYYSAKNYKKIFYNLVPTLINDLLHGYCLGLKEYTILLKVYELEQINYLGFKVICIISFFNF